KRKVWVDLLGNPRETKEALRLFVGRCPQLKDVDPDRATKGGDYPPRLPPKAKAFGQAVFARAYWLATTTSARKILAQEVHLLAGRNFAITFRYPTQEWDMMDWPSLPTETRPPRD